MGSERPRPKRSLGQNFLVDPNLRRRIVEEAHLERGDEVLEIGPGRGALTNHLVEREIRLVLIELDDDLAEGWRRRFEGDERVEVVHGDVLETELTERIRRPDALKVVGNIPYNITSPLLFKLLERPRPRSILVMVQREVADRILAEPGGRTYGALAVGIRSVASAQRVLEVPRSAFRPRPRVDSSVIRIEPLRPEPLAVEEEGELRRLVRAAFQWRRKQLRKILRDHPDLRLPAQVVDRLVDEEGFPAEARPESFSPAEFVRMSRALPRSGGRDERPR